MKSELLGIAIIVTLAIVCNHWMYENSENWKLYLVYSIVVIMIFIFLILVGFFQ